MKDENIQAESREFVCICCPIGCKLKARRDGDTVRVTGNTCKRGEKYAIDELTAPKRTVTTTARLNGGVFPCVPVKTSEPIPKDKIFAALYVIKHTELAAPVEIGDIAVKDICGTGADVVVTRAVACKDTSVRSRS